MPQDPVNCQCLRLKTLESSFRSSIVFQNSLGYERKQKKREKRQSHAKQTVVQRFGSDYGRGSLILILLFIPTHMGCLLSQKKSEDKGNPQDFRIIWNKCLKIDTIALNTHKKKYHPVFEQITKDIDRTFPGHPFFADHKNKNMFEKILRGFSLEFPKVGYTQGINFLAGYLLVSGFNESEALKALVSMCIHPELMAIGLYEDEFPLCRLYCSLFWSLAKKNSPQAYQAIKAANLPDELWIFQWFLTFFIYSFPLSYIPKFLNFIVIKRQFSAVRIAVAILQCLEKYISGIGKRQDGFLECFELMKTQQFCRKFLPIDEIIKKAQKIKKETISASLQECKENSWYRCYFFANSTQKLQLYEKYLQNLKLERQSFSAQAEMSLRYTRLSSNMTIIDYIQESIVLKYYERASYRSSAQINTTFFSRLSMKRYNSMADKKI